MILVDYGNRIKNEKTYDRKKKKDLHTESLYNSSFSIEDLKRKKEIKNNFKINCI